MTSSLAAPRTPDGAAGPHPAAGVPVDGWVLEPGSPGYPTHLTDLPTPPVALYGRGDNDLLDRPGVGVVGTSAVSGYGQVVAEVSTTAALNVGGTVVTTTGPGVARVVRDAVAAASAPLVVVAAGGWVDQDTAAVVDQVVTAGGVVVSTVPFGHPPTGLAGRPRVWDVLAGLCGPLVLAEATGASASVHAAWVTLTLGRTLLVAPPKTHAHHLPGAQAPLVFADPKATSLTRLEALGAPEAVRAARAGRGALASGVAADRDDLTVLVQTATLLARPTQG